jgi:predicted alpha/beta hydrolase family esterase
MMLARLMRWLLGAALALALGLLGAGVVQGETLWGVLGCAAILTIHAWSIAIECLWAARARGPADPGPAPTARDWLAAWWGEARTAPRVFFWQQPFRLGQERDHLPADAAGRRGVVLVHGFFCNRGFWNRWMRRLRAQGTPFVAVTMEPPFAGIEAYVPTLHAAVRRLREATGLAPVIVAHSMGGLASRAWAAATRAEPGRDVARLITLGTPHQGTAVAALAFSRNGSQMRHGSAWLQRLAANERDAPLAAASTAFYSPCDNIVFPPSLAQWPGAEMRRLDAPAHVQMADRDEPWAELQRWLNEPAPRP